MITKILAALLIIQSAQGGLPPPTIKGQLDTSAKTKFSLQVPNSQATDLGGINALIETGNKNKLKDPGFEATSTAAWTASAGTFTQTSTAANVEDGAKSASWVTTGSGQTLDSTGVVITSGDGLSGSNGVVSCRFKAASGTATHTITVFDGTNNLVTPVTITSSTTGFYRTSANFIFPSSGTVKLRISSVSASEPTLYVDSCYLGLADGFNLGSVSQATLVGTIVTTGCASNWSASSTSMIDMTAQTGCTYTVTGQATSPSTMIPAIKFSSGLPPGEYKIEAEGSFIQTTASKTAYYQFWDGTNTARETSAIFSGAASEMVPSISQSITYTAAQGSLTFSLRCKTDSGGVCGAYGTTGQPLTIRVYRYPTTSETVYRADQMGSSWNGYFDSTCNWSRTSTSVGDFTADATCALVEMQNNNFGTVTTSGSVLPAVTFTPKKPGRYLVIAKATASDANAGADSTLQLTDGTTLIDSSSFANGAVYTNSVTLSGVYYASSTAPVTLKVQGKSTVGALVMDGSIAGRAVSFSIASIDQSIPTPVFVGSVTSGSAGAERIERATVSSVCSSGTCTMSSSTPGISSIVRTATGKYTINFATPFSSAAEYCSITAMSDGTANVCQGFGAGSITTSSFPAFCFLASTNAANDSTFVVQCEGPR